MRKSILLVLALTLILAVPTTAGRITSTMLTWLHQVYQAYPGYSDSESYWAGYAGGGDEPGTTDPVISSVPGILAIDPGDYIDPDDYTEYKWPNFIGAAQEDPIVPYTIKNTMLVKECPDYVQCAGVFPGHRVPQQGTPNIRLWWPLMYEVPSCTFTLTILYGTPVLYDDDGDGPNPAAWVHVEQWVWHVDADLDSLSDLLELFHELPYGKDEVPLISDEPLYYALQDKLDAAITAYEVAGDTAAAAEILADFELEVMDACIYDSPDWPNPTGPGTGIANTDENPACCKLLVDVEYILMTTGIGQPKK